MTEPATAAAGGIAATKLLAGLGAGLCGAIIMAAADPPKTRGQLIGQATVAGTMGTLCTPWAVRVVDHLLPWVDLARAPWHEVLEISGPVGLLIGAMSWGIVGMLVRLRAVISNRGAEKVAAAIGLSRKKRSS